MKKRTLSCFLVAGLSALALSSYRSSPGTSGAGNRTGAAGSSANCATGCHAASSSKTLGSFMIAEAATPTVPVTKYVPGKLYTISIAASNSSAKPKFGFQAAVTNVGGTSIGTIAATAPNTAVHLAGTVRLVEHTLALTGTVPGAYNVQFNWTAPAKGAGTATFYGILNAVDGNNSDSNDEPSNGFKLDVPEDLSSSIAENKLGQEVRLVPNPATDHFSIRNLNHSNATVAVYGMNGTQIMSGQSAEYVNISGLAAGNYVVQINDEGNLSAAILVKQ